MVFPLFVMPDLFHMLENLRVVHLSPGIHFKNKRFGTLACGKKIHAGKENCDQERSKMDHVSSFLQVNDLEDILFASG
jgi:hypothetical protein